MPRGDKSAYTEKQKRQAEYIEDSYEQRGVGSEEAERRAWATVNKLDGGGKKSGSGRKPATGTRSGQSASKSKAADQRTASQRPANTSARSR